VPDGDGSALLRELRGRGHSTLPAIALTGYADPETCDAAQAAGFALCAVKPFQIEQLSEWLVELSVRRSGRRSAATGPSCHAVADRAAPDRRRR
jgi:CheY-like chemotaxis protein